MSIQPGDIVIHPTLGKGKVFSIVTNTVDKVAVMFEQIKGEDKTRIVKISDLILAKQ